MPGLELVASKVPCVMSCSSDSGAVAEAVLWEPPAAHREGGGEAISEWRGWVPGAGCPVRPSLAAVALGSPRILEPHFLRRRKHSFDKAVWGQGTVGNTHEHILDDTTALPFLPIFIA